MRAPVLLLSVSMGGCKYNHRCLGLDFDSVLSGIYLALFLLQIGQLD